MISENNSLEIDIHTYKENISGSIIYVVKVTNRYVFSYFDNAVYYVIGHKHFGIISVDSLYTWLMSKDFSLDSTHEAKFIINCFEDECSILNKLFDISIK